MAKKKDFTNLDVEADNLNIGNDSFFPDDKNNNKDISKSEEKVEKKPEEKVEEKPKEKTKESAKTEKQKDYIVKTFGMYPDEFSMIENFIRTKRMDGDIRFTQKQAINEALNLLRDVVKNNIKLDPIDDGKKEGGIKSRTFNLYKEDFEFIEDLIRKRRMEGQIRFTQRSAILEAFSLVKKKYPNI